MTGDSLNLNCEFSAMSLRSATNCRVRNVVGHFDSGIVSEHKSSEVGGGNDPEFCGYESLEAPQSRGDRLDASEKDEAPLGSTIS